jgi:hypothetical protein
MSENCPQPCCTPSSESGQGLDWTALVALLAHPTKVLIVEAMRWIDRPLSASELAKVFDGAVDLSSISYHVTSLASYGILTRVRRQRVRGALKNFYAFTPAVKRAP